MSKINYREPYFKEVKSLPASSMVNFLCCHARLSCNSKTWCLVSLAGNIVEIVGSALLNRESQFHPSAVTFVAKLKAALVSNGGFAQSLVRTN